MGEEEKALQVEATTLRLNELNQGLLQLPAGGAMSTTAS